MPQDIIHPSVIPFIAKEAYLVCEHYHNDVMELLDNSIIIHGDIHKLPIRKADLLYISNILDYEITKLGSKYYLDEITSSLYNTLKNLLEISPNIVFTSLFLDTIIVISKVVHKLEVNEYKVKKHKCAYYVARKT